MSTNTPQNRFVFARAIAFACLLAVMFASRSIQPASGQMGTTRYVTPTGTGDCSSWENACGLQTALATAQPGSEIWVAAGTYKPTTGIDRTVSFNLKDGVAIYGGFAGIETVREDRDWVANVTIFSGEIGMLNNPSDNSLHVIKSANLSASTVLDGFTITGGNANTTGDEMYGGGIYLKSSGPVIANVIFSKNFALDRGGAVYVYYGSPTFNDCSFFDNTSQTQGGAIYISGGGTIHGGEAARNSAKTGGGLFAYTSNNPLQVSDFTFRQNQAETGGAVSIIGSSPNDYGTNTFTRVVFHANTATREGGAFNSGGYGVRINEAVFSENSSGYRGGAVYDRGYTYEQNEAWITNTLFIKNSAVSNGGGIYVYTVATRLINTTFFGNSSAEGGGVSQVGKGAVIRNSILWGNIASQGPQIYEWSGAANLANSIVQGWTNDTAKKVYGNLNPLFLNTQPGSLDLRLRSASPAADMGNSVYLPGSTLTDLDGNPRVEGSEVDLGAYEMITFNQPPVLNQTAFTMPTINEDDPLDQGVLVADLIADAGSDPDGDTLGIAANAVDETKGQWEYQNAGETGWARVGPYSSGCCGRLLAHDARIRFRPNMHWNGTLSGGLTFRLWDMQDGLLSGSMENGPFVNTLNGPYSTAIGSVSITVNPINDPPTNGGVNNPSITGVPVPGQTLTVNPGLWDDRYDSPDSIVTITYQWQMWDSVGEVWVDIPGATAQTFAPVMADVGKSIRAQVTATDNGVGEPPSLSASAVTTSRTIISVTDIIQEGDTVSVVMDEDSSPTIFKLILHAANGLSPTWRVAIPPGHGTVQIYSLAVVSYMPTANYNGTDVFTVEAVVGSVVDSVTVNVTINPRNDVPVNVVAPSLLSIPRYGFPVTANTGEWNDSLDRTPGQITLSQQWQVSSSSTGPWTSIPGMTSLSYIPRAEDVSRFLRLLVTATDDGEALPEFMTKAVGSTPVRVLNNPPWIVEGTRLEVSSSPVLLHANDADGHILAWRILIPPYHGTASVNSSGMVTYALHPSCGGMDTFWVAVSDGVDEASIEIVPPAGSCRFYVDDTATTGDNNGFTWDNAFTDLQNALTAASPEDEIWVAAGVYRPTTGTNRAMSFQIESDVRVYGGFRGDETHLHQRTWKANPTVLSGNIGEPGLSTDNSYHVVRISNAESNTLLDGFIIQDGYANGVSAQDGRGGGILNYPFASPTLVNLIISNNYAYYGGGIKNWRNSSPTLSQVTFENNEAGISGGGMSNQEASNPVLSDVLFTGNLAKGTGGGMVNGGGSNPRLYRVYFLDNATINGGSGGAVYNEFSSPTFIDVVFEENTSRYGGAMNNCGGAPMIINGTFIKNTAATRGGAIEIACKSMTSIYNGLFVENTAGDYGGAIINSGESSIFVVNATLTGNRANKSGAIHGSTTSTSAVFNSILWDNPGVQDGVEAAFTTFDHAIVKGIANDPAKGVYGDEAHRPFFVNAENLNFRLVEGTSGVDGGLNDWLPPDTLDLDGDDDISELLPVDLDSTERIRDEAVDLGAYETLDQNHLAVEDTFPAFDEDSGAQMLDVLANDSDPDGGELTISAVTQGSMGSVSIQDNKLRYIPRANAFGTDTFTYTVSNGAGLTDTAMVFITINPVNDEPDLSSFADTGMFVGSSYKVDFTISDVETGANALQVSVQSSNQTLVPAANITVTGSGSARTLTVTPAPGKMGVTTITVTVTDADGGTTSASFTLTVEARKLFLPLVTE